MAVQRAGGLIGEDHFPTVHQGAGDTDPLLLAAGQLRRLIVGALAQPQPQQQLMSARQARAPFTAGIHRRHFDILRGGQMGQQMVALKDKAKVFPPQTGQRIAIQLRDIGSRHPIGAAGGFVEAAKDIHQRRFSRAGGAHDRHHLPGMDTEGDPLEDLNAAVAGRIAATNITQLEQGRHFAAPLALSPTITSSPSSSPCTTATSVSLRAPMTISRSLTSPVRNSRTW